MRLLESYVASPVSALSLKAVAPGQFRLPVDRTAPPLSSIEAIAALGRPKTLFLETELNAGACRQGTTVTYRYDTAYPATDFSRTVLVQPVAAGSDPTRLFEAVYTQFQGIDVSDSSPSCLQRVLVVTGAERLPLLLPAQLPAGWQSQRQYQRIVAFR
jgi:hypothetical protein